METKEILEKAKKELISLTGFKSPAAIGLKKEGIKWIATIEIVEKVSIPEGMDILGTYEVTMSDAGKIHGYKRIGLRKRMDTGIGGEE
ncbi:gas vesicle protein [Patescibacteria group bacterium]|nr:gas vesicle protein [Patescibacteria group bacterium]